LELGYTLTQRMDTAGDVGLQLVDGTAAQAGYTLM
jgi:hypothetical protein